MSSLYLKSRRSAKPFRPARGKRQRGRPGPPLRLERLEDRCLPSSSAASYGQLPLAFEPNLGQAAAGVDYVAHGKGYALALTAGKALLGLQTTTPGSAAVMRGFLQMSLLGADGSAVASAATKLPGISNYLIGNDPSQWHTNIPTYGEVAYRNVYPGVDLLYHGTQGQLEYDFVVNPGGQTGAVRITIAGAASMTLDGQGNLILHAAGGNVVEQAPLVYQEISGQRQMVAGRYVLQNEHQIGFAVGAYDASLPLVIDPVLLYSTFLGGSGTDVSNGIAVDASGSAYVVGYTGSTNFPTAGAAQGKLAGADDAFVTKLNPSGTALVYSTYLGGSSEDQANAIAVDASGNAYVTGFTQSTNFPTVAPFQAALAGSHAFVAKLSASGSSLVYSTYLGGSGNEAGNAITVDASGDAYVTGFTNSSNFPTFHPLHAHLDGSVNAFVTKLNPAGSTVAYSTYLGGSGNDNGFGIAVDAQGAAYVAGRTSSTDFPAVSPVQDSLHGTQNAFVTKLGPSGLFVEYSTYLGGSGTDTANAIAVDASGSAYVTGSTSSVNFPTVAPFQPALHGAQNAFVSKLTPVGSTLVYSTFLGGGGTDGGQGIAVDVQGAAYVTGVTQSPNFPTTAAVQTRESGGTDVFVTKLEPSGSVLAYSTFLGGTGNDNGTGIALDGAGNAYVTGLTTSQDFPTASHLQGTFGGNFDGFVAKIASHFWQFQDVAVGSDAKSRVLWDALNGQSVQWSVDNSFHVNAGPVFGAFSGWTAQANAAGSDGLTRLLWTNSDGSADLWLQRNDGMFIGSHLFGPLAGWSARDVAVGSDGNTRLLWTNLNGQAAIWSVDGNFNVMSSTVFGPIAGWTATNLTAGADGLLRLLWTNSNGAAALWVLSASGAVQQTGSVGPIAGWTARDVSVGSDNRARILWGTANGQMVLWSLDSSLNITSSPVYGPFPGDQALRLESGSDGVTRVLWNSIGGDETLWLLNLSGGFVAAGTFGPL